MSEIWAVAGGKGGSGKSFVSTTLGINLANRGKKVILLDADIGGANLHSFLRIRKPVFSLSDFFDNKVELKESVCPTRVKNLKLIVGDIRTFKSDSLKYTQKLKLFRHIKNLDCDVIIIDMGAGSNINTLDTFLMAEKKILVTTPEITSIENLYVFAKKTVFRAVTAKLREKRMLDKAKFHWKHTPDRSIASIKDFINYLKNISPEFSELVDTAVRELSVNLILNQIKKNDQLEYGFSLKSVLNNFFFIDAKFTGYFYYNHNLWDEINDFSDRKKNKPTTVFYNKEADSTVTRLIENRDIPLINITGGE